VMYEMKRLAVIFAALGTIILILVLCFSALQLVINNANFISNEYTKLQLAPSMGVSNTDLVRAAENLIAYMEGSVPSINTTVTLNGEKQEMFTLEQEHSHMEDVRTLYQSFRSARDLGILVMLVLYLVAVIIGFRRAMQTLASGYLWGAFVLLLLFGFLGTWAALDFTSFWTAFHNAFFWNDEWLFDASQSRMINMLPEAFFADVIKQMALYAGGAMALLLALAVVCKLSGRRKKRAANTAAVRAAAKAGKAKRKAASKSGKAAAPKRKEKKAPESAEALRVPPDEETK